MTFITRFASVSVALSACTYGTVTRNGKPDVGITVTFRSCHQMWDAMTDSDGHYELNPYNDEGKLTDLSKVVGNGGRLLILHHGSSIDMVKFVTVKYGPCAPNQTTEEPRCFKYDVANDGQVYGDRQREMQLFVDDCYARNEWPTD